MLGKAIIHFKLFTHLQKPQTQQISVLDHIQYLGFDERDGHPHGCGETGPY